MPKVNATLGWTRRTVTDGYHTKRVEKCAGIDFEAVDGLGNKISVSVRDNKLGHRITLNGVTISLGEWINDAPAP